MQSCLLVKNIRKRVLGWRLGLGVEYRAGIGVSVHIVLMVVLASQYLFDECTHCFDEGIGKSISF